jgi:hypothetical protein
MRGRFGRGNGKDMPWTEDEDALLMRLASVHVNQWVKVAKDLAGFGFRRKSDACRQHYITLLKQREVVIPSEMEMLALHRPWIRRKE